MFSFKLKASQVTDDRIISVRIFHRLIKFFCPFSMILPTNGTKKHILFICKDIIYLFSKVLRSLISFLDINSIALIFIFVGGSEVKSTCCLVDPSQIPSMHVRCFSTISNSCSKGADASDLLRHLHSNEHISTPTHNYT